MFVEIVCLTILSIITGCGAEQGENKGGNSSGS